MKLADVVVVIGLQNRSTNLVENLCRSVGIDIFYALSKENPQQRIGACDEEAIVSAPFEQVPENVFRMGLMAADSLFAAGTLDCNFTQEREMFGQVLGWIAHRVTATKDLPDGWLTVEQPKDRYRTEDDLADPDLQRFATGQILAGGQMVVRLDQKKQLVQLPQGYNEVFPILEGFCV